MLDLRELIEGENYGHTEASLLSPGYGAGGVTVPVVAPIADYVGETSGSIPTFHDNDTYGYSDGNADIEQLIDKGADGWTGPSLDGFVGVSYAGNPGYGVVNDQLGQSGETSTGAGWTVPSDEVGIGRAPGHRMAHMPHVQQNNPRREQYVDQGVFADGMPYFLDNQILTDEQAGTVRAPFWRQALDNPGMNPDQRYLSMGSAIIDQPPSYALSQILGALGVPGWGIA